MDDWAAESEVVRFGFEAVHARSLKRDECCVDGIECVDRAPVHQDLSQFQVNRCRRVPDAVESGMETDRSVDAPHRDDCCGVVAGVDAVDLELGVQRRCGSRVCHHAARS
ncbi:hypothetical protein B0T36_19865 [Nocardia donostiensis]|nr:hypothetical protein B0T36_19865 [Nocardia donostiensis]